jgi:hypothetical protein
MVQAAEDGTRDHTVGHDRLRSVSRAIESVGTVLADALVGPARVVVVAVLVEDVLKMALAEDEEVIESIASDAAR